VTAIVGLAQDGRVLIGGDAAAVAGYTLEVRKDPKVFTLPQRETGKPERPDVWAFGYTTSFRMGQILQYGFTPPALADDTDLDRVMRTTFVDALRSAFKAAGWARTDNGVEETGQFLVGVNGRLFTVDADYQVGEPADGYAAVGCGKALATGSLHTTRTLGWEPSRRVTAALEAAAYHSAGVCAPFTLVLTADADE
jgi:ATP-dependent protease HslVU (ClpYQ) peptidase subunit